MKYNEKYDRWVTKSGLVYRYNSKQDKLVLCKLRSNKGYMLVGFSKHKKTNVYVHRLVWETFMGEIPKGYQIDHINTIRDDNRLENLKLVTHKENMNNPLTLKRKRERTFSEFGAKFKEHFGFSKYEDNNLYQKERYYYKTHNKVCRWEVEK